MNLKTLLFAVLAIACCALTGCNEDATKDDASLSQDIIGSWVLSFESDNTTNSVHYTFTDKDFTYATYATKIDDPTPKMTAIKGTWRIYKGILELTYNLESLNTSGYDADEVQNIYNGYVAENKLVNDLKNSGSPYGQTVTFGKSGNTLTMKLSFINGTFMRTSY